MTTTVGKSLPRIDARGKVTGETEYSGDLSMPGMLHMKMLFADRPHARVLWIKTEAAEAAPGVVAVVAESEAQAAAAIKLIEVGYEDRPVITDPLEAMKPDSPRVHEFIGDSNICVHY